VLESLTTRPENTIGTSKGSVELGTGLCEDDQQIGPSHTCFALWQGHIPSDIVDQEGTRGSTVV
jgi:hypothetical protein